MSDKTNEHNIHAAGTRIERAHKAVVQKVTAYLPRGLAVELRDHCHENKEKITDVLELALREYLAKHKK